MKQVFFPAQHDDGLRYHPVKFKCLPKAVFVIDDGKEDLLVDLRSLIEAIGMSWLRWRLLIRHKKAAWGAEECVDTHARETYLIPAGTVLRWMAEVHQHILSHSYAAALRAKAVRHLWRDELDAVIEEHFPRVSSFRHAQGNPTARKITGELVADLHRMRTAEQMTFGAAARKLGISASVAKQVASDRYPHMSDEARAVWERTFGAFPTPERPKIPASRRKSPRG